MKLWKRNAVVAAIVLFVCAAVYLNWSYGQETAGTGKVLGQAALVGGKTDDPLLLGGKTQDKDTSGAKEQTGETPNSTAQPQASGAPSASEPNTGTGYFASARLNRQQARDSALTMLQDSAGSETADAAMKEQMTAAIETMASTTVSEAQIENLVTAKGYTDCVAFISENSASVVVAASGEGLSDADIARITEIVTGETGLSASQIKIIEAEP
ncbi:SpoIIIAH-like family protein [Pseudoflavonifractor sp. 524-17]|nr:SpoIIIAH-like family protein [Pseudoflavonifractor sp. 524-17]